MSIGTGVALVVIGAILAFAVQISIPGVDIHTVGLILLGVGAVVFVVGLILALRGRRSVSVIRRDDDR